MNTSTGQKTGQRSIVVAGSSTRNMQAVALLLQRFGYEVFTASTAAQALESAAEKHPALVITDLTLPDMSGLELFQKLREMKRTGFLPVIFMVFPGDSAAENKCMGYGAAGCISKPVQTEELYQAVQQATEPRPRASIRIDTRMPVSVNNLSLDCNDSECNIDLSANGMYVPTDKPYPSSRVVRVQLHMKDRTISTDGAVLYYRPGGAGRIMTPGMALKFTTIAPQDKEFIRKFIRDEIAKDLNRTLVDTPTPTW